MILLFPRFREIPSKVKMALSFITLASPILNVAVKKILYSLTFFLGTGNTSFKFSLPLTLQSLKNAVLSIFQYSRGPEYLNGLQFSSMPLFYRVLVLLSGGIIFITFCLYFLQAITKRESNAKHNTNTFHLPLVIFLMLLFLTLLIPLIFQRQLELRWFQAPFSVALLMFVVALTSLWPKSRIIYALSFLLIVSFLLTNYYYINKGSKNLYYSMAARIGDTFDKAIKDGVIRLDKTNLYIWEKKRNPDRENEIKWTIGGSSFFDLYGSSIKNVMFVDSLYQRSDSSVVCSFQNFEKRSDQIIFLDIQNDEQTFRYSITDITNEYLRDSLNDFNKEKFGRVNPNRKIKYDKDHLVIMYDDFSDFLTDGFHQKENGIRWTNGNASIEFIGGYAMDRDTALIEMKVYLPAGCKDIVPKVSVTNMNNKVTNTPLLSKREDAFVYMLALSRPDTIKKINIVSDTIHSYPDLRKLSFPFISLEMRKMTIPQAFK
jgi:hypothetical protein